MKPVPLRFDEVLPQVQRTVEASRMAVQSGLTWRDRLSRPNETTPLPLETAAHQMTLEDYLPKEEENA